MNICVFDTETTSLKKPFCYNIGYLIADSESGETLIKREFIVEQVWHNTMAFASAYYAGKRSIYVKAMRSRVITMDKFGYITQTMTRDFKAFNVERAFAYNSSFDEKVFNFNCDWFKCINPFDTVPISDIRGFVHHFLMDENFFKWAEKHKAFTENENYSTTAETITQYIRNNPDFSESHTALSDTLIETEILFHCLKKGQTSTETIPPAVPSLEKSKRFSRLTPNRENSPLRAKARLIIKQRILSKFVEFRGLHHFRVVKFFRRKFRRSSSNLFRG